MRVLITFALVGAALASLTACGKGAPGLPRALGPVSVADLPHRKAGLWRQTVVLTGSKAILPETRSCSDALSESKLNLLGQHRSKDLCQQQDFTRNPDGSIAFHVSCNLGPRGVTVSTGTISGDFDSRYQIAMDSKTTGAETGPPASEHQITITMTRTGPCEPGQRGGDLILADGRKLNLTDPAPGVRYR